ncbi:translocation/assembly module TamB domain-containing protein [Commensalibacter papalotli (ex Botero et al. 2024)]|uniref:Autotransporter translocation and assembly protein TamB (TamB) (PDB:5VTG) n=1 Tax=Commensalibacter papalotli (ex Botero et al. 2024) TaxID=2972766 RepID=A0ABN8WEN2_9PROT|nr:translocation/assembly module TamB domain-containing protein [Commensalibacter papalotli (ex Botero et al. 2024)]CAI3933449.1 Autotransporter translocation and assembly protein TamB (TamB) (PDB:5VTG) [Commensalibacter papalotli (ex Botero et al. 2024)]CAI3942244.1 Autotransporter translocation and assembly protein TamB (TamB) (PDB:5VTG) [Commensalibacter papalotli (ex Botero et al. 2024)]
MQPIDQQTTELQKVTKKKWRQRHRFLWVLGWLFGSLVGLVVVAIACLIIFANTQKGQHYLAKQIGELTGHSVEVSGLSGSFPNHLRVDTIELKDPKIGVWLSLKQTELDWSLLALLRKEIHVDRLYAKEVNVYNLPSSSEPASAKDSSSSTSDIVVSANINDIQIDKLFVADKVAPIDIAVGLKGKIFIQNVLKVADFQSFNDLSNIHLSLHLWELNQATDLQLLAEIGNQKIDKSSLIINAKQQSDGLIERLLKMDQLTPLSLSLSLKGPFDKLQTKIDLSAAQTKLNVNGDIDLIHSAMDIALTGHSPAMTLSPTIGWGGWNIDAKLHGAFQSPAGAGKFELTDLAAGDAMVNKLLLQFKGEDLTSLAGNQDKISSPWVRLNLVADGLRIPGAKPKLLAGSPLSLDVVYHPKEKDESVDLQINHHLIKVFGRIFIKPALHGSLELYVPELKPLAETGNVDLKGSTVLNMAFDLPEDPKNPIHIDLDGPLMITGGLPIAVQMIGQQGHIGLHAQVTQEPKQKVILQSLVFNGKQVNLNAQGSLIDEQVKALLNLEVKDLSAAAPMVKGKANAQMNIDGSLQDLAATLKLSTTLSTTANSGYVLRPSQLELTANAQHVTSRPIAVVALMGNLDQTPVNIKLQAGLAEKEKQYYLKLEQMEWRGLKAVADIVLPEKSMLPIGTIKLDVARLSDFGRLINQKIDGNIHLDIHSLAEKTSKLLIDLNSQISMPQAKIGKIALSGYVDNPVGKPNVNLKLQANQLQVPKVVQGNALMTASGGMDALKLTLNGNFPSLLDAKGNIDTALVLDLLKKKVDIQKFTALVKGENIRLLAPLQAEFGEKWSVNRLRLSVAPVGAAPATVDIAGTIKPKLAITASIQNITPALAKPFAPDLHAKGVINIQAQLKGSLEKPQGNIRLNAQNMQLTTGSAASLPPAQLTALANLNGTTANLDTRLQVGQKVNAIVNGTVPLQPKGNIALRLNGDIDLAVANAIVGASGQQVKGLINIAMLVNGSMSSPAITGAIHLTKGSFRDYAQGVTLRDVQASILGQRDRIVLQSFSAKAGEGSMNADGQIGIFQPGIPVNLHFGMNKAKPLVSDLLTAILDGDINIKGMAKTRIDVGGTVKIKRADINIPHSMARSVVPLKVIRPGDKVETSQSSGTGPEIGLDLTIKSAGQILVRGFGLFTDMAGSLHIGGTANAPKISGGFEMQNGHIDMAGISLEFTRGIIGFKGSNVDHKIDPSLDFEVKKSVEGNTVSLGITGYASSPKISLSSSPPLSQDRVLAMLLFGVDSQSLSTTQMAEIGVALATLGGEGSGFDPIGTVRKSLGLDRLSVGGGSSSSNQGPSSGTSVSAGKYLMKGVYLGAKQSTGTQGTQAEMQVDITKRLKATATVGTGEDKSGFVTPDNDPGSSIGLLYKFDY